MEELAALAARDLVGQAAAMAANQDGRIFCIDGHVRAYHGRSTPKCTSQGTPGHPGTVEPGADARATGDGLDGGAGGDPQRE